MFWCGVVFGVVTRGAAAQGEKLGRKITCKGNNAREKRIYKITLRESIEREEKEQSDTRESSFRTREISLYSHRFVNYKTIDRKNNMYFSLIPQITSCGMSTTCNH